MSDQVMVNEQLRKAVRERAKSAGSEKELGNIIFACLKDNGIPWKHAGSESVKLLLVDAVRAYRTGRRDNTPRVAV